jgi:hypothetical protein
VKAVLWRMAVILLAVAILGGGGYWAYDRFLTDDPGHALTDTERVTNKDIGAGIRVSGEHVPKNMRAEVIPTEPMPLAATTSLSETVRITPHGQLPGPVTLAFKLKQRPPQGTTVFVITRREGEKQWRPVKHFIAPDGVTAMVQTDHLSEWQILGVDIGDILKSIGSGVADFFGAKTAQNPKPLNCPKNEADAARKDGYSFDTSKGKALLTCFKMQNGKRKVVFANTRNYPLYVTPVAGFGKLERQPLEWNASAIARLGKKDKLTLMPNDQASYEVNNLEPDHAAKLVTRYDGYADSLVRIQVAIEAFVAIITKSKAGSTGNVTLEMRAYYLDYALTLTKCVEAAKHEKGAAAIARECIVPLLEAIGGEKPEDDKLRAIADKISGSIGGWLFDLLVPVIAAVLTITQVVDWLFTQIDVVIDQITGGDEFTLLVKRADPIASFAGTWSNDDTELIVSKKGGGQFQVQSMCTASGDSTCFQEAAVSTMAADHGLKVTLGEVKYYQQYTIETQPDGSLYPKEQIRDDPARMKRLFGNDPLRPGDSFLMVKTADGRYRLDSRQGPFVSVVCRGGRATQCK